MRKPYANGEDSMEAIDSLSGKEEMTSRESTVIRKQ